MGKTIGEGSFSKVKIGYHRENHKKVKTESSPICFT